MRIAFALVIIVLTEIGIRTLDALTSPPPPVLPERSLQEIPMQLGGWTGQDVPFDPAIFDHSGAAVMLNRNYRNLIGDVVVANVGMWLREEVSLPHSPQQCYPGAGWEIVDRTSVTVPREQGGSPAILLALEQSGQRILVLYWYQYGDRVLVDGNELRSVRQSLRRSNNRISPIIKVMLQSNNIDPSAGQQQLVSFASQLLPELAPYR